MQSPHRQGCGALRACAEESGGGRAWLHAPLSLAPAHGEAGLRRGLLSGRRGTLRLQPGGAETADDHRSDRGHVVDYEPVAGDVLHAAAAVRFGELTHHEQAQACIAKTHLMTPGEIGRRGKFARRLQITGRDADNPPKPHELAGDQARLPIGAIEADSDVHAFRREAVLGVVTLRSQLNARMCAQERRQLRRRARTNELPRHAQPATSTPVWSSMPCSYRVIDKRVRSLPPTIIKLLKAGRSPSFGIALLCFE